jgi:hypothetical protein
MTDARDACFSSAAGNVPDKEVPTQARRRPSVAEAVDYRANVCSITSFMSYTRAPVMTPFLEAPPATGGREPGHVRCRHRIAGLPSGRERELRESGAHPSMSLACHIQSSVSNLVH